MCADLARKFEAKCTEMMMTIAALRTELNTSRDCLTLLNNCRVSRPETVYFEVKQDEAFERLKAPEFRQPVRPLSERLEPFER